MIDLNQYFLDKRIIFIDNHIDDYMANNICKQLYYLDLKNNNPIKIYINSGGGSVTAGLAIYDTIKSMDSEIITIATGMAASMAAFLLSCGDERYSTKNCTLMWHQPSSTTITCERQTVSQILIEAEHAKHTKDLMIDILAYHLNKPHKFIDKLFSKDTFLTPKQAIAINAIDGIIK